MSNLIQITFDTMGTTALVTMGSEHAWKAQSLRSQLLDVCSWFDQSYSTYRTDSDLQLLRASGSETPFWPAHFQKLAEEGRKWEAITAGHFTMTTPAGEWDPTGLVKAKAIDALAIMLHAQGIGEFSVNIGGDIGFSDYLNSSELSRVAISRPVSVAEGPTAPLMVWDLASSSHRAVATSGTAERGDHIWSDSSAHVTQATVAAKDISTADVWATALVSGETDALERFIDQGAGDAVVITRDGHMIITEGVSPLIANPQTTHELIHSR